RLALESGAPVVPVALLNTDEIQPTGTLIPTVKPVIVALDVDDRGRLWVRRESADPVRTEFDVFDANGRAVASVSAPFRIPPDGRVQVKGDVMYAVAVDGDDVPYVIRSRVHTR
ncbi:MAG: hypothetical protein ACLGIK_02780, partial [Gemmatimonadota bacterium]